MKAKLINLGVGLVFYAAFIRMPEKDADLVTLGALLAVGLYGIASKN